MLLQKNAPSGIMKARCIDAWRFVERDNRNYQENRRLAQYVVRSLTSRPVDEVLALNSEIIALKCDDPIGLLKQIKTAFMSLSHGITLIDRENALNKRHSLVTSQRAATGLREKNNDSY